MRTLSKRRETTWMSVLPALPFLLTPILVSTLLHSSPGYSPASALLATPIEERAFRLEPLTADRNDVPLIRATALFDQKFRALYRAGLLQGLPSPLRLDIRIDASGAITAVGFDRPCGKAGKLLESQLLGWRLEAWTVPGVTTLRLSLEHPE